MRRQVVDAKDEVAQVEARGRVLGDLEENAGDLAEALVEVGLEVLEGSCGCLGWGEGVG